ncbi:MAG: LysR family transcriptional regulator [Rubrivivax sp.]|nr:LysR family transcriptional regulator [Rubrivivax sp.]
MKNFRTLDLNLLRVFDTLMSEGSLTRAADVLSLTQPAASHALKRLHAWVGEPLFQRSAVGMTPTARAVALWPSVRSALMALQQTLAPTDFDPARDAIEFHVTMAAAAAATLAPGMVRALVAAQAVADLRILPLTTRDPRALLHDGLADLAIGDFPALLSALVTEGDRALVRHLPLHRTDYVCVMRRGHPLADGELTLDRYCAAQHVLVTVSGQAHAEIDEALALLGRRRRVLITVNQYTTAGQVITQSDLVTVLPASFVPSVASRQALVTRPLPVTIAPLTLEMVWLARRDAEPAHRWLRDAAQAAAGFASEAAAAPPRG